LFSISRDSLSDALLNISKCGERAVIHCSLADAADTSANPAPKRKARRGNILTTP
jgi:hypothetical protein